MKLKIYSNKTNQIIHSMIIPNELLNQYDINVNDDDFTELFETEILNDIFEQNNIELITWEYIIENTYYELI